MYNLLLHTAQFTEQDRAASNSGGWKKLLRNSLRIVSSAARGVTWGTAKVENHLFFSPNS